MGMLKYGHAAVVTPVVDQGKWVSKKVPQGRIVVAKNVIAKYDPSMWLLSHVTIIASVDVDRADPKDKKSDYLIKPEYSIFVNNNGDSWERNLLKSCYRSFLGADNYVEHVQIDALSKGKVIDVALREVPFAKDSDGKDLTTLYVDILIATNRKHADIVEKITSGEYSAVSMGCGLAGTKIVLPNGSFAKIEEIKVGDSVLTHTGKAKRVTKLFSTHVSDIGLYSIDHVGANEPLRLTGEHPILLAKRDAVRCRFGKEICHIDKEQKHCYWESKKRGKVKLECGRDKEAYKYGLSFVPISEITKGDYVAKVFPTEMSDSSEFTTDICRLLGIYAGDGYMGWQWEAATKEKLYPAYIGFCFGRDEKELIDEVQSLLKKVVQPDTTITLKDVPERNGLYINVYDKFLAKLFYDHCGEGAWTKSFSNTVMLLPKEKQLIVASGMFDTDGCFHAKTSSLHYASSSESLINQLHIILLRNGIGNAREKVFRRGSGKKPQDHFQETVSVEKSFSYMIPSRKNKLYGVVPSIRKEECFFFENYYMCRVTSVSSIRFSGTVYNFSVEDDESYAVNDVAVHNCLIKFSICSQCGNIAEDESKACKHVRFFKNNFFYDKNGIKRIVAELCGRVDDPESCRFIDASWVRKPAFEGALLRNIIQPTEDVAEKIQKAVAFPSFSAGKGMFLKAAARAAAEELVNEVEAQEAPAAPPMGGAAPPPPPPAGAPPADNVGFPQAPAGAGAPLAPDAPPPPAGGDLGAPPGGDLGLGGAGAPPAGDMGLGGAGVPPVGGGGMPGTPGQTPAEPQIAEPTADATVKELKTMVKTELLNQIRRELLKEQAQESQKERPVERENAQNDSIIKRANLQKVINASKAIKNDRLQNGLLILSNLKDWKQFKKYGYSRDDVLGILCYMDKVLSSNPVQPDAIKALTRVKMGSENLKSFFTDMIIETGRKPSVIEARKLASWARILRNFEGN